MSLASDLKVLYHLTLQPIRGKTHAERLESFYGQQADAYDGFRKRLLQGRKELFEQLPVQAGDCWVDLGAGTGSNAEYFGERIKLFRQAYLVDLSPSLLKVADRRIADRGWSNVQTLVADATQVQVPVQPVDLVTFSYSLTMIPDWFATIDRALELLKPGGHVGVVDFYVSRKYAAENKKRHGWWTRTFWPTWFGMDNVFLSPDHVPYLQRKLETVHFAEHRARVPYLPLGKVPYYSFIGRKPVS